MIYEQHQGFSIETNKRSKHYSMSRIIMMHMRFIYH